jgi:CRP-like cAMP-binding protein
MAYTEALSQLFRFLDRHHPIGKEPRLAISEICSIMQLGRNDILQPAGRTCRTVYFINSGIARIFYLKDGVDITEGFAFEDQVVARVESLFTGRASRKSIQVLTDAEVVAMQAEGLSAVYDRFPETERLFRRVFESLHVDLVNRIERIQFNTAEERYRVLLSESPDLIRRVPLKHIASYLGITQVSLSRIRSRI